MTNNYSFKFNTIMYYYCKLYKSNIMQQCLLLFNRCKYLRIRPLCLSRGKMTQLQFIKDESFVCLQLEIEFTLYNNT